MQVARSVSMDVLSQLPRTSRKLRRPKHTFQVRAAPWTVQPFCIAPVQPGETLKQGVMQARVISDPIKNPIVGWWVEYYWFYVRLRDLEARDELTELMLDPAANLDSLETAAKVDTYHYAGSVDFTSMCLKRVVEEYFRDEGEAYDAGGPGLIAGMPLAKANPPKMNYLDSAQNQAQTGAPNVLQDPHYDVQIAAYQAAYDRMRMARMVDMDFDDWLGTFGINVAKAEQKHVPELIRYHREWTYPANTVEATTGVPSSAASWGVSDRLDKDRFFKEPGFIFGVTVSRPKIYLSNLRGSGVHMLDKAEGWLPALLGDQPWSSLRQFASGEGPVAGQAATPGGDYWVDVRDLFLYGDQFVNFALTETDAGFVALPATGMQKAYVSDASRKALFSDGSGVKSLVRQDGVVDFSIMGSPLTTKDHT